MQVRDQHPAIPRPEVHHKTVKGQEKSWEVTRALPEMYLKVANKAKTESFSLMNLICSAYPPALHMQYVAAASTQATHLFSFGSRWAMHCLFPCSVGMDSKP